MESRKENKKADGNQSDRKGTTQIDLLRRSINWVINDKMFADFRKHGNTKWTPRYLLALAVLAAWSEGQRMTGAFDKATKLSQNMFAQVAICTFQGMMRALVTSTAQLLPLVWSRLHELMQLVGGEYHRIGGWLPLAVDGSRFATPRTKSNEKAF